MEYSAQNVGQDENEQNDDSRENQCLEVSDVILSDNDSAYLDRAMLNLGEERGQNILDQTNSGENCAPTTNELGQVNSFSHNPSSSSRCPTT